MITFALKEMLTATSCTHGWWIKLASSDMQIEVFAVHLYRVFEIPSLSNDKARAQLMCSKVVLFGTSLLIRFESVLFFERCSS